MDRHLHEQRLKRREDLEQGKDIILELPNRLKKVPFGAKTPQVLNKSRLLHTQSIPILSKRNLILDS